MLLLDYSKRIPWRAPNLKLYNIDKFFPQIAKYYKEFGDESLYKTEEEEPVDLQLKIDTAHKEWEMETEGATTSATKSKDPQVLLIKELLNNGCSKDELCNQGIVKLSKKYIDITSEEWGNEEDEISDDEISGYLRSEDEVSYVAEQRKILKLDS